jgi:hypothetical protein
VAQGEIDFKALDRRIAELETQVRLVLRKEIVSAFSAGDCTNGCTDACTHGCTNGCTGSGCLDIGFREPREVLG